MALQPHVIKAANEGVVLMLQGKEFIETVVDNVAASIAKMALDLQVCRSVCHHRNGEYGGRFCVTQGR